MRSASEIIRGGTEKPPAESRASREIIIESARLGGEKLGFLNPSIIRCLGRLLMVYRYNTPADWPEHVDWRTLRFHGTARKPGFASRMRATWLDDMTWQPDPPHELQAPSRSFLTHRGECFDCAEDGRLFWAHGKLWLAYAGVPHFWIAEMDPMSLTIRRAWRTPEWRGKNWQVFEHEGRLLMIYCMHPQIEVHEIDLGADGIIRHRLIHEHPALPWTWGEMRGGTAPIRIGDAYFACFHSSTILPGPMKWDRQYHAAWYAFKARAPFAPVAVARRPWMSGDVAAPQNPATRSVWGKHAVVFPCGAIVERGEWLVSYGWQDRECRVTSIGHEEVLEGMR